MGFKEDLLIILEFEGGYVNDPIDPGGATNKGVTQLTYDNYRLKKGLPKKDVREITFGEVEDIYLAYYKGASCDRLEKSHPLTATAHFDFAINAGPSQANKILQRAVGAEPVDGKLGNITFAAINETKDRELYKKYSDARLDFYKRLVDSKPALGKFLKGWTKRTNHLRSLLDDRSGASTNSDSSSGSAPAKCSNCGQLLPTQ